MAITPEKRRQMLLCVKPGTATHGLAAIGICRREINQQVRLQIMQRQPLYGPRFGQFMM
jgi:hypothetical protein